MKNSSRIGKVLGAALGMALLARSVSMPAFATLGGDATSVETDRAKMKGQARVTATGGYTVNEIQLPSGTAVREYVSSEGQVFAVTWHGPAVPDLQQTLGPYVEQLKAAAALPHGGHHHLSVQQPGFVAHIGGHMRAWSGQAYVPGLLPPNFALADIK